MRRAATVLLVLVIVGTTALPSYARPWWKRRIDKLARGRSMGISTRYDGDVVYGRSANVARVPASNQKLLLSMALLDRLGANLTVETSVGAVSFQDGVVDGDLWILGHGDPTLSTAGRYARALPFAETRLGGLARRLEAAGVTHVAGSVMGSTGYFGRDWWARGWKSYFPTSYVALPVALSFNGNVHGWRHIDDPELRAARALTRRLERRGITVTDAPGAGTPPAELVELAEVRSVPLAVLMRYMNHRSSNFFAEVLGKRLGAESYGGRGTIAKGAAAVEEWAAAHRTTVDAYDGSGLSYANRASANGVTRLLTVADDADWGATLRVTLPKPGRGTLEDRLKGVRVRAKTGTLVGVSSLSGWVWLRRRAAWAEFSILSSGLPKYRAVKIENKVVRTLARFAR